MSALEFFRHSLRWATALCKLSLWPWYYIYFIVTCSEDNDVWKVPPVIEAFEYDWHPTFLITYAFHNVTIYIVAYLCYAFTFDIMNESNSLLAVSMIIISRDLLVTFFFYGLWHWILYGNHKYHKKLQNKKFNSSYPAPSEWKRDRFLTVMSTLITSFYELIFYCLYKNGYLFHYKSFWNRPIHSIFWILVVPHWKSFYFYCMHRGIHPWFKRFKWYDFGRVLYKYVHSVHHQISNPSPWSGLAFHPIETVLYYFAILFPWILGVKQHYIHFLFSKYHSSITPLRGHDGFAFPGTGQSAYFHYLHHRYFNCNYGTEAVPMDKLFDTFQDGSNFSNNIKLRK